MFRYGGTPMTDAINTLITNYEERIKSLEEVVKLSEEIQEQKLDIQKINTQLGGFEILKKLWHEIDNPFVSRDGLAILLKEMETFLNNIE
jgi:hypothetical protein